MLNQVHFFGDRQMRSRKISELENYEEILAVIKTGNPQAVIATLYNSLTSNDELMATDEKGKTLLAIIKEAKLDFNQKQPLFRDIKGTLLESLIGNNIDNTYYPFDKLDLILRLGADPNHIIDEQKETALHRYVTQNNIQAKGLKLFIDFGGDFDKKNSEGKSPLDMAPKHVADFIRQYQMKKSNKTLIKAVGKWRQKTELARIKKKPLPPVSLPLKNAQAPVANPPDPALAKQWIAMHKTQEQGLAKQVVSSIQHIPHEHFLFGLKCAVNKFNRYLLSLPKDKREYILALHSDKSKSDHWVAKLAEKYLLFPPKLIIATIEINGFKCDDKTFNLQHIVLIDASYSGNDVKNQLNGYTKALAKNQALINLQLHYILPFISEPAALRLSQFDNVIIHTQEQIPGFNLKETLFAGKTATYFDHKVPVSGTSTIEAIGEGKLIGNKPGVLFVKQQTPPYKQKPTSASDNAKETPQIKEDTKSFTKK